MSTPPSPVRVSNLGASKPRSPLLVLLLAALLVTGPALPAAAQAPTTLNYQGRLLQNTAAQDAVTGSVDIAFSIWSDPAGDPAAVELWSEAWTGVTLSNGIFSVLLGSNGSPLDPADFQGDSTLFLQLSIDGETLLPRQQLGSAPFAIVDEPANEIQDPTLTGNSLGLTDSAVTVDLSPYLDNTDEQTLALAGNTLSISGSGSSVDLSGYTDTDSQDLTLSGNTLALTNDPTTVSLAPYLDNTDEQDLTLAGTTLALTGDPSPVSLAPFLDNTDAQTLALAGNTLSISGSGSSVNLSGYLDNTDSQTLNLAGTTLSISGSGSSVNLSGFTNTDAQTLSLSGTNLSISGSGSTVNLAGFLDNTDSQNLSNVLAVGNDAGNRDITNLATLTATGLNCPDCVDTNDIDDDTIGGNDITDNIYILWVDCNGECSDMSMRAGCDVIEDLRGLSVNVELIGVSCVYNVPSTPGNGFVPCNDSTGSDNECRAFNLRTLGDIPCIDGVGTDAIITCLETNIPK